MKLRQGFKSDCNFVLINVKSVIYVRRGFKNNKARFGKYSAAGWRDFRHVSPKDEIRPFYIREMQFHNDLHEMGLMRLDHDLTRKDIVAAVKRFDGNQ